MEDGKKEIEEQKYLLEFMNTLSEAVQRTGEDINDLTIILGKNGKEVLQSINELDKLEHGFKNKLNKALKEGGSAVEELVSEIINYTRVHKDAQKITKSVSDNNKEFNEQLKKLVRSLRDTKEITHAVVKSKLEEVKNYKEAVQASEKYQKSQAQLKEVEEAKTKISESYRQHEQAYNDARKLMLQAKKNGDEEEVKSQLAKMESEKQILKETVQNYKEAEELKRDHNRQLMIIEEEGFAERVENYVEASQQSNKFSDIFKGAVVGSLMQSEKPLQNFSRMMDDAYSDNRKKSINTMGKAFTDLFSKGKDGSIGLGQRFKSFGKGMASSVGSASKAMGAKAMGIGGAVVQKLMETLGKIASTIGKLTGITSLFKPLEVMAEAITEMLDSMVTNSFKFQRSLGASANEASKLATELTASADFMVLGPDAIKSMNEGFQALVEYTGSYRHNVRDTVRLVAELSEATQISSQESAMFVDQMQTGLQKSSEEIDNMVSSLRTDAQGAGVSFKLVMQDVAKNGARMSMYGEQIAMGIMKASVRARELGTEMGTWTGLMDSFGDGWEGITTFVTDFNRLAGQSSLDIWDLQQKRMSGDIEGFQDTIIEAVKNMDDETRKGYLGTNRLRKTLNMGEDEYAKFIARIDLEKVFDKQIGDVRNILGPEGMFGVLEGDDKTSFNKSFDAWKKGMINSKKDVDKEIIKMQRNAMQTALNEAIDRKLVKNADEFTQKLKNKDKEVVGIYQMAMREKMNFQTFEDIQTTLEKSLSPQDSIEGFMKELVKKIMPSILELMGWMVEGLGNLLEVFNQSFFGPKSGTITKLADGLQNAGKMFTGMGQTFAKSNLENDIEREVGGKLQQVFDAYAPDKKINAKDLQKSDPKKFMEELSTLMKNEKMQDDTKKYLKGMYEDQKRLLELNKKESTKNSNGSNSSGSSGSGSSGGSGSGGSSGGDNKNKKSDFNDALSHYKIGKKKGILESVQSRQIGYEKVLKKSGREKADEWLEGELYPLIKKGSVTKVKDVAFTAGQARYVIDNNDKMFELDPKDALVASTNFDLTRDNITSGTPLPEGSLQISTPLTTDGKGGKSGFKSSKDIENEAKKDEVLSKLSGSVASMAIGEKKSLKQIIEEGKKTVESTSLAPQGDPSTSIGTIKTDPAILAQLVGQSPSNYKLKEDDMVKKEGGGFKSEWMPLSYYPTKWDYNAGKEVRKLFGLGGSGNYIKKHETNSQEIARKRKEHGDGKTLDAFRPLMGKILGIMSKWGYKPNRDMGTNSETVYRTVGEGNTLSNHSFGMARDINSGANPDIRDRAGLVKTNMPPSMIHAIMKELGDKVYWGGWYQDAMHFEMNKASDMAFDKGKLKYILDKGGNAYSLMNNESAMISTQMQLDELVNAKNKHYLKSGSIYQKIPVPKSWHDQASSIFGEDIFGQYVHDAEFKEKLNAQPEEKSGQFASWALKKIGYSDYGINSRSNAEKIKRIYDELFYGYNDDIKKSDREKDMEKVFLNFLKADSSMGDFNLGGDWENSVGQMIARHEGKRREVYLDTEDKPTVGIGHLLNKQERDQWPVGYDVGENVINSLWEKDFAGHYGDIKKNFPDYDKLDPIRRGAITDMAFNLGAGFYKLWPIFTKQIQNKEYAEASKNILGTKYAKQVKGRGKEIASMIETGKHNNELNSYNISDAYFGEGEVQAILGVDGKLYKPSMKDRIGVSPQFPNATTNTNLAEGKLNEHLAPRGGRSGGGSSGSGGSSNGSSAEMVQAYKQALRNNEILADKMDRLIRAVNDSNKTGGGGDVVLDGMKVGRFVDTNRNTSRRKGMTLNG